MFVKICGTTSEEDALLAVACGADAVGFVFAPSPRQVTPSLVADIVKRLPTDVLTVGVFRNESAKRVVEVMQATGLRAAQLHGSETPETTAFVRERVGFVIKGFGAGTAGVATAAAHHADAVLLDNPEPGSGRLFDWRLAGDLPHGTRLILAGGLTPDNVADAIAQVRPWGVDVVTGVESEAGRKDPRKVRAFVAAAKAAAPAAEVRDLEGVGADPYDWQADA